MGKVVILRGKIHLLTPVKPGPGKVVFCPCRYLVATFFFSIILTEISDGKVPRVGWDVLPVNVRHSFSIADHIASNQYVIIRGLPTHYDGVRHSARAHVRRFAGGPHLCRGEKEKGIVRREVYLVSLKRAWLFFSKLESIPAWRILGWLASARNVSGGAKKARKKGKKEEKKRVGYGRVGVLGPWQGIMMSHVDFKICLCHHAHFKKFPRRYLVNSMPSVSVSKA